MNDKNKEKFINDYEFNQAILNPKTKWDRFREKLTLRNVIASIFLIIGIIISIIYACVSIAYMRYNSMYQDFSTALNTMGINKSERNYFFSQFGPYKLGWVRVYHLLGNYFIIFAAISLIISIVLWAFVPNFSLKSIFNRRKGKNND